MRKTLLVAALIFCGLWSASQARADVCNVAGNLVTNCAFQSGDFTGWTVGGNTANPGGNYYGVDALDAYGTSAYGAYMSEDNIVSTNPVSLSQTLSTVAGVLYQITFYLEQDTAPTTGYTHAFSVLWDGTTMLSLAPTTANPNCSGLCTPGVYTKYTFDATAAGADALLFFFRNDDQYWSFDDVSAIPAAVPEPADVALVGTALGAFLLLRRRFATA